MAIHVKQLNTPTPAQFFFRYNRRYEGVVVQSGKVVDKPKGKHLDDQVCAILRLGAIVLKVVQPDG